MQTTVKTAPNLTRKLVKSAPYVRSEITRASKAEESGTKGAREQRERLTADFARDHQAVETAIEKTEAIADDLDRAHIILKTGSPDITHRGPISSLAAIAVRLGADSHPALEELTAMAATRASSAAEQAKDRISTAEPELRSVALLAQLRANLPSVKFDMNHPKVRPIKHAYFDATKIAADRRKGTEK